MFFYLKRNVNQWKHSIISRLCNQSKLIHTSVMRPVTPGYIIIGHGHDHEGLCSIHVGYGSWDNVINIIIEKRVLCEYRILCTLLPKNNHSHVAFVIVSMVRTTWAPMICICIKLHVFTGCSPTTVQNMQVSHNTRTECTRSHYWVAITRSLYYYWLVGHDAMEVAVLRFLNYFFASGGR